MVQKKAQMLFIISILFKGVLSFFEICGGIVMFFISKTSVVALITVLTQEELTEDPKDVVTQYFVHMATNFSVSTQHFLALYLLTHGIIKMFLIVGLFKKKMWAYSTSIIVFSLFIVYQMQRYTETHSLWLLCITVVDILVVFLVWNEYKGVLKEVTKLSNT